MPVDAKAKDIELWKKWKSSHSIADLEILMKQMNPVIQREVGRWASIVPRFVLEGEAKQLSLKAFESFDLSRGVQLSTHVVNQLQKLSRMAYNRQSTLNIPEHKRLTYNRYRKAIVQLEDELGMKPTMDHVADFMGLPKDKLHSLLQEVEKVEYLESEEYPPTQAEENNDLVHLAYHDMTDMQKKVFRFKTGYDNTPIKDNAAIITELKITQGQLSYELTKIKNLLQLARKGI